METPTQESRISDKLVEDSGITDKEPRYDTGLICKIEPNERGLFSRGEPRRKIKIEMPLP